MESGSDMKMGRRCVVWHRCGVGSCAALLSALESRGLGSRWGVETSDSGHEVLAMGCVEQRKGRGNGLIVVLDGGGRGGRGLESQDRVIEGMERFCPSGLVWVYEEGANPPLRGFVGDGGKAVDGKVDGVAVDGVVRAAGVGLGANGAADGVAGRASLRLSGLNGGIKSGSGLRASDVLDRDELAALLNPDG